MLGCGVHAEGLPPHGALTVRPLDPSIAPDPPILPEGSNAEGTRQLPKRDEPTAATRVESAGSGSGTPPPRSRAGSSMTPVTTPLDALHLAEIKQVRLLAIYAAVLCFVTAVSLEFMGGEPLAKNVQRAGLAITVAGASYVVWRLRNPANFQPWVSVLLGASCAAGVVGAYYYWGAFSSAIVCVPMGLYLFAGGRSVPGALMMLILCAVPHAILGALIIAGVSGVEGVIRPVGLRPIEKFNALVIAQFIFGASFVLARRLRRSTIEAIEELERAVRGIAQREALLNEAKRELDRALRVGGPGRFTDAVIGSYKLGNVLGRGAMGEVYEAAHVETGDAAAVKLLTHSAGSDPGLVQRFLREVRIAASLRVPNVVRVIEAPPDDPPIPYMAMERLVGENLGEILRRSGHLPLASVIELLREVTVGVEAAHTAGIVHRDLKPGNLFLHRPPGEKPVWKILDFGVSKLIDRAGTLTKGHVVGTPEYMAPEQARGEEVDQRADTHALGVITYRTLTGRPAFGGPDIPSILYAVTHEMPPRPSTVVQVVPAVDAVLAIAMAKDRSLRFQKAGELAAALAAAAEGHLDPELKARADRASRDFPWGRGR